MAIPLGRRSPGASRDRPGRRRGSPLGRRPSPADPPCRPYLVLLPVGFAVPSASPRPRCALTAPFHPCRRPGSLPERRRSILCGTVPGVAPAGRYPAPCFHGARTFLPRPPRGSRERPSGRLARVEIRGARAGVNQARRPSGTVQAMETAAMPSAAPFPRGTRSDRTPEAPPPCARPQRAIV
jgi:hypothetical protein